jgi:hypothetical protein
VHVRASRLLLDQLNFDVNFFGVPTECVLIIHQNLNFRGMAPRFVPGLIAHEPKHTPSCSADQKQKWPQENSNNPFTALEIFLNSETYISAFIIFFTNKSIIDHCGHCHNLTNNDPDKPHNLPHDKAKLAGPIFPGRIYFTMVILGVEHPLFEACPAPRAPIGLTSDFYD